MGRKFFPSVLLILCFFVVFAGIVSASESDYGFCIHAPYNSCGGMCGEGKEFPNIYDERFQNYIDEKIRDLEGIEIIRNSGATGLVPKVDDQTSCQSPPCFKAEPHRNWINLKRSINHIHALGLEVMMMVTPPDEVEGYNRDYRDWEDILVLKELVRKAFDDHDYADKVKYWQIGSEPGVTRWTEVNPATGNKLLTDATIEIGQLIREKCSDCKIVLAAVGGELTPRRQEQDWQEFFDPFLEELKGKNTFDIFDFHFHHQQPLEWTDYRKIKDRYNAIRGLLAEKAYPANIPIWITEISSWTGTPDGEIRPTPRPPYPEHSEEEQVMELVKRYLYSFSLGVKKVFWSPGLLDYSYGGQPNNYFSNVGLIYKDGIKKLSYDTLKLMIKKLNGFQSALRVPMDDDNLYLLKFEFSSVKKPPAYVLWKEGGAIDIDLSDLIAGEVTVTTIKGTVTGESVNQIAISQGPKFIEIEPIPRQIHKGFNYITLPRAAADYPEECRLGFKKKGFWYSNLDDSLLGQNKYYLHCSQNIGPYLF